MSSFIESNIRFQQIDFDELSKLDEMLIELLGILTAFCDIIM